MYLQSLRPTLKRSEHSSLYFLSWGCTPMFGGFQKKAHGKPPFRSPKKETPGGLTWQMNGLLLAAMSLMCVPRAQRILLSPAQTVDPILVNPILLIGGVPEFGESSLGNHLLPKLGLICAGSTFPIWAFACGD